MPFWARRKRKSQIEQIRLRSIARFVGSHAKVAQPCRDRAQRQKGNHGLRVETVVAPCFRITYSFKS